MLDPPSDTRVIPQVVHKSNHHKTEFARADLARLRVTVKEPGSMPIKLMRLPGLDGIEKHNTPQSTVPLRVPSHGTCPALSFSAHAHSFLLGPEVMNIILIILKLPGHPDPG
jgi:hypothetical protein